MRLLGLLLCRLGFHKGQLVHPENGTPVVWATIGQDYKERCTSCHAETGVFTLTRDMLP